MAAVSPFTESSLSLAGNVYVGPRPFRAGEKLYCRDREAVQLVSLLVSQRLVLLHSPSGAGKTSLVQSKLIPAMQRRKFEVPMLPDDNGGVPQPAVIRLNREPQAKDAPGSNRYLLSALSSLESRRGAFAARETGTLAPLSLARYLRHEFPAAGRRASSDKGAGAFRPLLLIFDQFEELLTLDPTDQPAKLEFIRELAEALENPGMWALFAIRDDFLGALEPYLPALPTRLAATYHMDLLRADAAAGAIVEPARLERVEFEDGLVDKLIDDLRQIQVQQPDGTFSYKSGTYVEPVQLQVVCRSLWHARTDLQMIRHKDLETLGGGSGSGVDEVLAAYYARNLVGAAAESGVSERLLRDWFGRHLITSQGVRRPVLEGEALEFGLTRECLRALDKAFLIRRESMQGVLWYELAHDRLVGPVQQNNRQWRAESLSTCQRQAELWDKSGRPADLLASGTALREAESWAEEHDQELTEKEQLFLDNSRKAARTRRLQRQVMAAVAVAVAALLFFAVYSSISAHRAEKAALEEKRHAEHQTLRADEQAEKFRDAELREKAARERAVASEKEARGHLARAEQVIYASHIRLAQLAWDKFDAKLAWHYLNDCQWDLRGWEHDYLYTRFNKGQQVLTTDSSGYFTNAVFSPNGRWVAASDSNDVVHLWDARSGKTLRTLRHQPGPGGGNADEGAIDQVVIGPRGRRLASGGFDCEIKVWNVKDLDNPLSLVGHTDIVTCVVFSPDGDRLVSASGQSIKIWDLKSGASVQDLTGHTAEVTHVAFSPDGSLIASASLDNTVRLWDAETGEPRQTISEHKSGVYCVAFSPDGGLLASAGGDHTARIWDIASEESVWTFLGHTDKVFGVAFSPNGRRLASASRDGTVKIWDTEIKRCISTLTGHTDAVNSVAFCPDGRRLVSASSDETVRLWDLAEVAPHAISNDRHVDLGTIHARSPDGRFVLTAHSDEKIAVRDVFTAHEIIAIIEPGIRFRQAVFSPDNRRFVCLSDSIGAIQVRDLAVEHISLLLTEYSAPVRAFAFSPQGHRLASAHDDTTVNIWDAESGECLFRLACQPSMEDHDRSGEIGLPSDDSIGFLVHGDVTELRFSPDGQRLSVARDTGSTEVWDVTSGKCSFMLSKMNCIVFSPNGERMACIHSDNNVTIRDVQQRDELFSLKGYTGDVQDITFSPDGRRVVTASEDKNIKLWDAENGTELITLSAHDQVASLYFGPDGRLVAHCSDNTAKVWDAALSQPGPSDAGRTEPLPGIDASPNTSGNEE